MIPLLIAGGVAALAAAGRSHRRAQRQDQRRRAAEWLDVAADADARTVRAAWAKTMARAHPDAGGTAQQVRWTNRAREVLLTPKEPR